MVGSLCLAHFDQNFGEVQRVFLTQGWMSIFAKRKRGGKSLPAVNRGWRNVRIE
jgi:hypothetical protein